MTFFLSISIENVHITFYDYITNKGEYHTLYFAFLQSTWADK